MMVKKENGYVDLFKELLPSILQTKEHILEDEKDYNAFMVNRALSYHPDCIMYANEMNFNFNLDSKPQYDYLINKVRAKKRPFVRWEKPTKDNDLLAVKMFFGYSDKKAKECLKILTDEQIMEIKTKTNIGD
jgi:Bacteriophage clamp loader A subunit